MRRPHFLSIGRGIGVSISGWTWLSPTRTLFTEEMAGARRGGSHGRLGRSARGRSIKRPVSVAPRDPTGAPSRAESARDAGATEGKAAPDRRAMPADSAAAGRPEPRPPNEPGSNAAKIRAVLSGA